MDTSHQLTPETQPPGLLARIGFKRLLLLALLSLVASCIIGFGLVRKQWRSQSRAEYALIKQKGEPFLSEDVAMLHRTAATNGNAAAVLQQAFLLLPATGIDFDKVLRRYYRNGRKLDPENAQELASMLETNKAALAALEPAFAIASATFPLNWRGGYNMLLPHLAKMRSLGRALQGRTILHLERAEYFEVASDISRILHLTSFLENEPILVSQMVRLGICDMALEAIHLTLNKSAFPSSEISRLQQQLRDCQKTDPFTAAYMAERVFATEFLRDPDRVPGLFNFPPQSLRIYKNIGWLSRDERDYLRSMAAIIETSRLPFPDLLRRWPKGQPTNTPVPPQDNSLFPRPGFLLADLIPATEDFVYRQATAFSGARLASLALELELHHHRQGSYPHALSDLSASSRPEHLDPFSGLPFGYRRTAAGHLLFSREPPPDPKTFRQKPGRAWDDLPKAYNFVFEVNRFAADQLAAP